MDAKHTDRSVNCDDNDTASDHRKTDRSFQCLSINYAIDICNRTKDIVDQNRELKKQNNLILHEMRSNFESISTDIKGLHYSVSCSSDVLLVFIFAVAICSAIFVILK